GGDKRTKSGRTRAAGTRIRMRRPHEDSSLPPMVAHGSADHTNVPGRGRTCNLRLRMHTAVWAGEGERCFKRTYETEREITPAPRDSPAAGLQLVQGFRWFSNDLVQSRLP